MNEECNEVGIDRRVQLYLGLGSAGAGALNVFLLAYPGDLVAQGVLVVVGAIAATLAAMAAFAKNSEVQS